MCFFAVPQTSLGREQLNTARILEEQGEKEDGGYGHTEGYQEGDEEEEEEEEEVMDSQGISQDKDLPTDSFFATGDTSLTMNCLATVVSNNAT